MASVWTVYSNTAHAAHSSKLARESGEREGREMWKQPAWLDSLFCLDGLVLGHIVSWDVSFSHGVQTACLPPVPVLGRGGEGRGGGGGNE